MPEEIDTESLNEAETSADAGTETSADAEIETTVDTIIIVPGTEDSLSGLSDTLNSLYVLNFVMVVLLAILCLFTIVRRSD